MTITTFNYLEALFWWSIAIVLLIRSRSHDVGVRKLARVAAIIFLLFGISDVIEAHTGAWWRPIWLLMLKAGCLVVLLCCLLRYNKRAGHRQKNT